MPIQQPVQTFTPNEVAELTGIAAHNVRRWAVYHANHLSDSANPHTGMARRFTSRDIEVLRHVDSLRRLGLTVPVINEQLAGLTFAEIDTADNPSADVAPESSLTVQEGQGNASGRLVSLDDYEKRLAFLEVYTQEDRRTQRDGVMMFGMGFLAACGLFILLLMLALLYGGFR
jgi:DNA-binding transcriptional MerR regulator